jgi:hypothetical protein
MTDEQDAALEEAAHNAVWPKRIAAFTRWVRSGPRGGARVDPDRPTDPAPDHEERQAAPVSLTELGRWALHRSRGGTAAAMSPLSVTFWRTSTTSATAGNI